ncbi:hypothetical protein CYLTODRAFT_439917 [Cylindrobasidium torrendii FP15055 ss-10]|uniref:SigF-like NTF2-like domain-containing protein n=1 Tax=Cylindrobasidium torrendii FP15055 ss-10 TaxID=1314674 RepID=A0A0D7BT63_9AGAR|nr:hypothetical protein CYLTODRAFT_439917 [Cylindrobasidium torrendii FP15055 ss-10]
MQNPAAEISDVFHKLTMASTQEIQLNTIKTYFTPDAGFKHPLCKVQQGENSRENLLGIYQWYRIMSPKIIGEVKSVIYDASLDVIILEVVQTFHIFLSPFKPAKSRLNVRLTLQDIGGLHYISLQEDYYHPEDLIALVLPPLIPIVSLILIIAAYISNIGAAVGHSVGFTGMKSEAPLSNGNGKRR